MALSHGLIVIIAGVMDRQRIQKQKQSPHGTTGKGDRMDDFVKERDVAFIHFVKTDDLSKVKAYCKRYGVKMPKDWKVMAAGVYKAVQYITSMRWSL